MRFIQALWLGDRIAVALGENAGRISFYLFYGGIERLLFSERRFGLNQTAG